MEPVYQSSAKPQRSQHDSDMGVAQLRFVHHASVVRALRVIKTGQVQLLLLLQ